MFRLLHCCRRTINQHQLLMLPSKSCTMFLPPCSSSGGRRGFSTARSQEETVVERLPNRNTPWLMLRPEIEEATGDKLERFYSPEENRVVKLNRSKCLHVSNSAKCISSTVGGWLGYSDPYDCSVYLSNPYTNEVIPLPSLTTLPSVVDVKHDPETDAVIGVLEERGDFRNVNGYKFENMYIRRPKDLAENSVTNMALSTRMLQGDAYAFVVAIQGDPKRLVYCPIGKSLCGKSVVGDFYSSISRRRRSRRSWRSRRQTRSVSSLEWIGLQENYRPGMSYHQAVFCFHRYQFFTIFENTGIQGYDLHDQDRDMMSKMVVDFPMEDIKSALKKAAEKRPNANLKALDESSHGTHYYLAAPDNNEGDLLLLVRHFRQELCHKKTLHFDVFKVDFRWMRLVRVDDIEYRSLFVGLNQSFDFPVGDGGLRPNCIYFSDDHSNQGDDCGIFDIGEDSILPLGFQDDQEKVPSSENCNYPQFWVSPDIYS